MQHFHAALLLGEVLLKLHVVSLVSVLTYRDSSFADRLTFDLAHADSNGVWSNAVRELAEKVGAATRGEKSESDTWLLELRNWLAMKRRRPDQADLEEVAEPLANLHAAAYARSK
jgi:hypothetical protein